MKRSKVINYLKEFLSAYDYYDDMEEELEEDADILLTHLEKLGMLPPERDSKYSYPDKDGCITFTKVNEWELESD